MRQRRTMPGRSVGKCMSKMMVVPERESRGACAYGTTGTNANETHGPKPLARGPVGPPRHASPAAPRLNTPTPTAATRYGQV